MEGEKLPPPRDAMADRRVGLASLRSKVRDGFLGTFPGASAVVKSTMADKSPQAVILRAFSPLEGDVAAF